MFDTVLLTQTLPVIPSFDYLGDQGFTATQTQRPGRHQTFKAYRNAPYSEGVQPNLTVKVSEAGPAHVSARVSLPKFLYGTNVRELDGPGVNESLERISEYVTEAIGIDFDASSADVSRLDVCRNYLVGESNILPFIKAVRSASPNRMKAYLKPPGNLDGMSTAGFYNGRRELMVYAKLDETRSLYREGRATPDDIRRAEGILRLESRFNNAAAVSHLAASHGISGAHTRRARLILVPALAEAVVNESLASLNLDRPVASDDCLDILKDKFGTRAFEFYGLLKLREEHGDECWRHGYVSRDKFYRMRRQLIAAGLWTLSPGAGSLPALASFAHGNVLSSERVMLAA